MKKLIQILFMMVLSLNCVACGTDDEPEAPKPETETPGTDNEDNPENPEKPESGKTLIVYYSYTNNVKTIATELGKQIEADVIEVQPAEKGLDYAANNYSIGSAQIAAIRDNPGEASSYPAIDKVEVKMTDYSTVIVAAPLWWSNMAAPMQSFLFQFGKEMAGKKIGLIVSSASSGISGVEADAKRLIPDGEFLSPSLWIRSSQTSNAANMLSDWLKQINF